MNWKCTLLLYFGMLLFGCSPTKIMFDQSSESSISELNNLISELNTTVYLANGNELTDGEFEVTSDSLTHIVEGKSTKYPISNLRSIKTIGDHSTNTILGLSLIGGGIAVFSVTPGKEEFRESPNDIREERPTESGSFTFSDRLKGNLLGSILCISGLIVLISGIKKATKIYIFE